jgi:signal transduction histidine kinase
MNLQALASLSPDPETARRLEVAVEDVDHAIRDLRNYIFGLRPGILADRQLDQALRELARAFSERTGVVAVVEVDADVASTLASRAPDIVQIVREALSNVGRHAAATTCRVRLARDRDGRVLLEVDDDGGGFDPKGPSTGMGLANLHERAGSLGGTIEIDSSVGQGTTLRITFPG